MSRKKVFFSGLTFVIIYFAVLKFVFPGYVKPFVPHHSDILDYAYDWKTLNYSLDSRPVGLILTYLFGLIGERYSIVLSSLVCVFGSTLLIARIVCYETKSELKLWNLGIYFVLLLAAPSFYINYSFDIYTTYSLFIGLSALKISYNEKCLERNRVGRIIVCFCLYLACFLCKETYILSFIYFHFCKVLKQIKKKKEMNNQIYYLIVCSVSACIALLYGKLSGSAFISANSTDITSPYYTCLSPESVIHTFAYYFCGLNNIFVILFLLFIVLYYRSEAGVYEVANLAIAGILAYLPYSVLPNKVVPHYIFVSYPFLLSLVFLVKFKSKWIYILSVCIVVMSVYYNEADNSYGYNAMRGWLKCDDNMELTLMSIDELNKKLDVGDEVLVLGLEDTTETLFRSVAYSEKKLLRDVHFQILNNEPSFCGIINNSITYVSEIGDIHKYSKIIQYTHGEVIIKDVDSFINETEPTITQIFPAQEITREMLNDDGSLAVGIVGNNIESQNVKIVVNGKIKTTLYGDGFISTSLENAELDHTSIDICLVNIFTNQKSNSVKIELNF